MGLCPSSAVRATANTSFKSNEVCFIVYTNNCPTHVKYSSLAPGASNLLKTLTIPASEDKFVDVSQKVRALSVKDWANVVDAFIEWPFVPQVEISNIDLLIILILVQDLGITDGIYRDREKD